MHNVDYCTVVDCIALVGVAPPVNHGAMDGCEDRGLLGDAVVRRLLLLAGVSLCVSRDFEECFNHCGVFSRLTVVHDLAVAFVQNVEYDPDRIGFTDVHYPSGDFTGLAGGVPRQECHQRRAQFRGNGQGSHSILESLIEDYVQKLDLEAFDGSRRSYYPRFRQSFEDYITKHRLNEKAAGTLRTVLAGGPVGCSLGNPDSGTCACGSWNVGGVLILVPPDVVPCPCRSINLSCVESMNCSVEIMNLSTLSSFLFVEVMDSWVERMNSLSASLSSLTSSNFSHKNSTLSISSGDAWGPSSAMMKGVMFPLGECAGR